ncbi:venom metalloproteinase antarease-like TtrivMP_A isoform X1 [Folsomia candida]|uniref:venom metalloproteinase antarease-like TtrivMP_A isoform X1 n=1 Tax=Folsomia candida TaxID=158441 RepID=UPI000B8F23D8|nr:venom metalloproteinase antarease-like TtrivMP_A isoform X1 [Folsomia candida]
MSCPTVVVVAICISLIPYGSTIPAKVKLTQTEIVHNEGYKADIHVERSDRIHLNLIKSDSPVFHPNMRVVISGDNGHEDVTPTTERLDDLMNSIYEDSQQNAIVSVVNGSQGLIIQQGIIDEKKINHIGQGDHDVSNIFNGVLTTRGVIDFVSPPYDPLDWTPRNETIGVRNSIMAVGTVEVLLVIDFSIQTWFGGNVDRITEYYALFIKSVNNIYAQSEDPAINFQVVGINVITTRAAQPYIENNPSLTSPEAYLIGPTLTDFSTFMSTNAAQYPVNDVIVLLTGETFDLSPDGEILGRAYISGACKPTEKMAIVTDPRARFGGVMIFAHEMGHTLGSWHDGQGTSADCAPDGGFLMQAGGGNGDNRFKLGSCSKRAINTYISSVSGTCLSVKNNVGVPWEVPSNLPGDLVDLNAFCRNSVRNPNARVDTDPSIRPDDMCYAVRCQYPPPCDPPSQDAVCRGTSRYPAPDGAACSSDGKCQLGRCVKTAPFSCTGEGTFVNNTDCRKYFRCIRISGTLYTYSMTCPAGSYFNAARKMCLAGAC